MKTSAQIRDKLVEALELDLIGPTPEDEQHAEEILTQAPSKWYLAGFLVPFGSPLEVKTDTTANEDLDLQTGNTAGEDSSAPETAAARQAIFPSSMGLSFLISQDIGEIKATVTWGDYQPIELETDEPPDEQPETEDADEQPEDEPPDEQPDKKHRRTFWQRTPHRAEITIPLSTTCQPKEIDVPSGSGLKLVIANRPVKASQFAKGTRSVSVFLVNYRQISKDQNRESAFAFQTRISLECDRGFVPRSDPRKAGGDWDECVAAVQYRRDYEFAVGHNVSAVASAQKETCKKICTSWIPAAEVPRVAPAKIPGVELGMEALANAETAERVREMVGPMVTAYETWISDQKNTTTEPEFKQVTEKLLKNAERAKERMGEGLKALDDGDALEAFKVANSAIAAARRQQLSQELRLPPSECEAPSWRPFQLAFILINLAGIAQPEHGDREGVDLLFFPTGGGKTEAYLGLAAFTLALRRLRHGEVGGCGVSVLMRYTLRLLTLDQLERASRLICALELERSQNPKLGTWPFEIGLWVGQSATPNRMGKKGDKDEYSARARTLAFQRDDRGKPSPIPLERCPWCGEKFKSNSFQLLPTADRPKELRIGCSNRRCSFRGDRPLPIIAVDESIYRRLPCFIIATVDKFANLPWVGQTGALFGKVTHRDPEGFYGDADIGKPGRRLAEFLPPPDLVIQDELHLISGPLGTMVGLYETAIDELCSIRKPDKTTIRPKIIASTATVRRADRQIKALFGRGHVDIFPPPGPDRHDSFFAKTIFPEDSPGRLYVGVAAQGRSLKVVLLRTYLALLAAAQKEWEAAGGKKAQPNPADPYMTLLGYFNSLRELGGSRRIVEDEVNSRLMKYGGRLRYGESDGPFCDRKIDDEPEELTSRVSTDKVANTKRRLALGFDEKERVDIALATNMISVGLDIVRLGLMVVLGQPKTAAEYIQSTSRVGRDPNRSGFVVTLLNIHRPRDRSHYERFESWHASFYRAVEATSVTPFSPRALDRGLAGVTVALSRLGVGEMTPALGASEVHRQRKTLNAFVETICRRAEGHNPDLLSHQAETLRQEVRSQVQELFDTWEVIAEREQRLKYNKNEDQNESAAQLLLDASDPEADQATHEQQKFKTPRSLRDVEPTVNLWVRDPFKIEIESES